MNTPQNGRRILWLVRSLAIMGLTMVVITIALVGHTLTTIRNERFRLAKDESNLIEEAQELRRRTDESYAGIQAALDEGTPQSRHSSASGLVRLVEGELSATSDSSVSTLLVHIKDLASGLASLADRTQEWRDRNDDAWTGLTLQPLAENAATTPIAAEISGVLLLPSEDTVALHLEQEKLKTEAARVYRALEAADSAFSASVMSRSRSMAQQVEHNLVTGWERFLITGAGSLAVFLWLAWLISRRIDNQVKALETARVEAERSRETTHQFVLEQQAAAAHLERALQDLQRSEQRFRMLSASAPVGIFETDSEGLCTYTNPEWQKIAGYPLGQSLGESWLKAIHPDDESNMAAAWRAALDAGAEFDREIRVCRPDGEVRWAHIRLVAMRSTTGEITSHVGTVEDITMRKEIEAEICYVHDAALESARLKSRFLANMSHEIRTPMNGVIGMANLLLDTSLTGDQHDFAETIRTSAEGLLTVINDILDFSKIEAGKMAFEEADFDMHEVFEGTLELLAEIAQRKNIELAGFIEPGVPTRLRGDSGRIRQVLTNLIGNAIKFTESGEVTAQISLVTDSESRAELRFRVRDTGIGISAEGQRRLFAAFTQADVSTTRQFGGTGLGLAICRQLVEKMGGQIGVKSAEGQGSTFWFTLPLTKQSDLQSALVGDHALVACRVLIVDDNPTSGGFLQEQIGAWRMRNDVARTGRAALALLREAAQAKDPYTLAIIDLDMPEMDGLALAREIHTDSQISGTRIVLLTAFGRRIPAQELIRAGIAECRSKPVRQSNLFDCLAGVMASSSGSSEAAIESSPAPVARRKERILIAEDNPVNQKVALGQLRKLGYRAEAVGNGFEALQALGQIPYDIVLMDCHMPEMDGYEATAAIRQHEGQERHTWIIAMTANAIQGDREQCLAAGMDDYVSKPVRLNELAEALERAHRRFAPREDRSVIDPDRIAELRGLSTEGDILADLTQMFVTQAPQLVAEIFDAHARADIGGVTAAAHFLKGSSGQFGAAHLHHVCAEIEKAGRHQSLHQMPDLLDSVAREVQHVIAALNKEIHQPEPKYA